jgi:hypothetical protein
LEREMLISKKNIGVKTRNKKQRNKTFSGLPSKKKKTLSGLVQKICTGPITKINLGSVINSIFKCFF